MFQDGAAASSLQNEILDKANNSKLVKKTLKRNANKRRKLSLRKISKCNIKYNALRMNYSNGRVGKRLSCPKIASVKRTANFNLKKISILNLIDSYTRVLFPIFFLTFNIIYFSFYFIIGR